MDGQEELSESMNLRPNRPDKYAGKRDFLAINTWIYKVDQYLSLMQISNPSRTISEDAKIMFGTSFLSETAAIWWFTLVQDNRTPSTWQEFKQALLNEFLPEDHVRRARDRLRATKQKGSVSKYISEYRNVILAVPDISEGEKFERFVDGLKSNIRLEVMKSTVTTFEEAAKISLRIDSALWKENHKGGFSYYGTQYNTAGSSSSPTPMEIGNVRGMNRRPLTSEQRIQRKKDQENNACYVCHTKNCRPWKCRPKKINNTEANTDGAEPENSDPVLSDSDSEKE